MATTTIVSTGRGVVGDWARTEYRRLVRAGLCQPVLWITGGDADTPSATFVGRNAGAKAGAPLTRFDEEWATGDPEAGDAESLWETLATTEFDRLRVVRLVLACGSDREISPADLWTRMLDFEHEALWLNVVVPTEDIGAAATVAASDALPKWVNVVASPEDGVMPGGVMRPIEVGQDYVLHGVCAMAAFAGLFLVQDETGPFDDHPTADAQGRPVNVILARTHSRTVAAPGIVDKVTGTVLRHLPPDRLPMIGHKVATEVLDVRATLDKVRPLVLDIDRSVLRFKEPRRGALELRKYIGFFGLLRFIWAWIRKELPHELVDAVGDKVDAWKRKAEARLQALILGGDDSEFSVKLFAGDKDGKAVEEDEALKLAQASVDLEQSWPYSPPAAAWQGLRETCFGLVDGGALATEVAVVKDLFDGESRRVIRDPAHICGPDPRSLSVPGSVAARIGWAHGAAVRVGDLASIDDLVEKAEGLRRSTGGDGDLDADEVDRCVGALKGYREACKTSLLFELAEDLDDERAQAVECFKRLSELIKGGPNTKESSPPKFRRRLIRILVITVGAAMLVAGLVFLPVLAPFAVIGAVLVGLGWFWSVGANVLGYLRDRWLFSTRRKGGDTPFEFARKNILDVLKAIDSLTKNKRQYLEWCEIIAIVLRDPLGSRARYPTRSYDVEIGRLLSHQVGEGELSVERFRGLVASQENEVFRQGWIKRAYEATAEVVLQEYCIQTATTDTGDADPDRDAHVEATSLDAIGQRSPRRWLRREIRRGRLFDARREFVAQIDRAIVALPPSDIADKVVNIERDEDPVGSFLREVQVAGGGGHFIGSIAGDDAPPAIAEWACWAPPSLGIATRPSEPPSPELFLFQSVSVEHSALVPVTSLRVLSSGTPRAIKNNEIRPSTAFRRSPVQRRSTDEVEALRSNRLQPIDDLQVGTIIEPRGFVAEPEYSAAFSFMSVVDGQPLRFPLERIIPFVVREDGGPEDGLEMVREAVQHVSSATGLSFQFDGFTEGFPGWDRPVLSIDDAPPFWIGWVFPDEEEDFERRDAIGLGGPASLTPWDGLPVLVTGMATVMADLKLASGFGPRTIGKVLLHELGHAMNLGHVDDGRQTMCQGYNPEGPQYYGPGDLYGLWLLGVGRTGAA